MKASGKKIITSLRRSAVGNLLLSSTNELDAEVLPNPEFDAGVGRKHAALPCCDSVAVHHEIGLSEGKWELPRNHGNSCSQLGEIRSRQQSHRKMTTCSGGAPNFLCSHPNPTQGRVAFVSVSVGGVFRGYPYPSRQ